MTDKPGLFGINNSNRDFTVKESWGKNQFNNSFPASLALYIEKKQLENNYITLDKNLNIFHKFIATKQLFNVNQTKKNTFFAFENVFSPYQKYILGSLPRVDLVIQDVKTGNCVRGIEIKLTALPDISTCELDESQYGCELVARPDTIVYLACSIVQNFDKNFKKLSYNTKNDKAFAINGFVTHQYMKSAFLSKPRITKKEIKNIILGGGQNLLSPERRFDAIIYNTPELFK